MHRCCLEIEGEAQLEQHLLLLRKRPSQHELMEVTTTPIFTMPILKHAEALLQQGSPEAFPQYGLLGGLTDPGSWHIFFNVATPSSTFICRPQGSSKSHTLSCLLENCLSASKAERLTKPAVGLVFHYDTYISDDGGSPCEAAFLSADPQIKRTYQHLNVQVEPLRINESDLNTKRILDLIAVENDEAPLYMHTIYRILRGMRISQQEAVGKFSCNEFKGQVMLSGLNTAQLRPLNQRLDTLERFMPKVQTDLNQTNVKRKGKDKASSPTGNTWDSKPGCLTIVDLFCPYYMNASAEALTLTNTLLSTIRLQRHLGARIIISTQEPTISPALLELCSINIAHRFTSPEWLRSFKGHLAALATEVPHLDTDSEGVSTSASGHLFYR
ncbi:hypothetical protein BJ878DRAFT_535151 [Calycina marina]|uniref:Uncharacterized protein n=1 Tax=Calycina marina TaxID=1763456 RepID=A0A9P7Z1U2_9HELO|nr:hypothetical protein BJ878DRAFT_535151 [Calycina marina]